MTAVCPLCETVLTTDGQKQYRTYPDVRSHIKILKFIVKLAVYFLIVLELVFLVADYYTADGINWSIITGLCFLYVIFTLFYSFNRRNSHIRKIYWQSFAGIVFLLMLDVATGATGWSLRWGLPVGVLFLDAVLGACMLFNRENWQSYLLVQLFALVVSVLLLALFFAGVTEHPVLPWTAFGVSAVIFSLCFCIGYRTAKNELRRRFYI